MNTKVRPSWDKNYIEAYSDKEYDEMVKHSLASGSKPLSWALTEIFGSN